MQIFRKGQAVKISFKGQTVVGKVLRASRDGQRLYLAFEGELGGYWELLAAKYRRGGYVDFCERKRVRVEAV
jgi:hypothetical protein